MRYRKFKADGLFTGRQILNGDNILITGENGIAEAIVHEADAGDDIKIYEGLITPGFINCHCHVELSHMKGVIEPDTGLVDFLIKVISDRTAAPEDI